MGEKVYLVYDGRAYSMGTDEATVLCTARSLKEARQDVRSMFPGSPIFEYDVVKHADRPTPELVNERLVE